MRTSYSNNSAHFVSHIFRNTLKTTSNNEGDARNAITSIDYKRYELTTLDLGKTLYIE